MTAGEQVRTAFDDVQRAILAASALVAEGHQIDLGGLDQGVATLCGDIAALPADQRREFKPRLLALIDDLGRLVDQIETQHRKISTALAGLGSRRNAVSAYGKGAKAASIPPRADSSGRK
jgi:hypothetical protein